MLLFRSEEEIGPQRGGVMRVAQLHELATRWYGDRLDPARIGDARLAEPQRGDDPERVPGAAAAPRAPAGIDARAAVVRRERVRHLDAAVGVEHHHVLLGERAQGGAVLGRRRLARRGEGLEDRPAQRELALGHAQVSDASSRRVRTPSLR